jgi:primosomal protein N' (replication factor Y) (superfamily II helicase)
VFAEVLTSAASWNTEEPLLTYSVPTALEHEIRAGQLVAIPYGDRLVEGIVWRIAEGSEDIDVEHEVESLTGHPQGVSLLEIRPISTILDSEPALLLHQRQLAEWMATYYITPLAFVAQTMLPPGLMQRSKVALRLIIDDQPAIDAQEQSQALTSTRALIGLLLADGELDVERLKEMLGPKRAKEVLKEALDSGLIAREAQLQTPRARARRKRVARLLVHSDALAAWKRRTEARVQANLPELTSVPIAPDNVRRRPTKPDPWALPGSSSAFSLTRENKEGLLAQRQLAAVDLLEHDRPDASANAHWTPHMLCKASGLTATQLQTLLREGIISIEEIEARRDPLMGRNIPASHPLPLTPGQQAALEQIVGTQFEDAIHRVPTKTPILLHGVTGSGKTEVYLQALAAIIARGKRGIMLVPEIALTAQAVYRFVGRFPGRVAIIHSALTDGERYDEWRRIRAGQVDVVIGSRSALFAPLPDLGMLILDEEHEPAYKQSERRPTYHAREAAIALGRMLDIPVVLGSATPSVESFYRAERQAYQLVKLPDRIGATLPPVEIIDLRDELHAGNTSIISRRLYSEIEQVLSRKQQAILYLNRRGAASCILCRECGFVAMCDKCDVPLTYHATERILLCHYCNSQSKVLRLCPQCGSESMRYFGLGTEKVVDTIERSFPAARLLRWDRDTARNRRAHEQLLDRFANREADILVGTQMIAKGLDLPGVTLVGVISADIALMLPDFSASERAFTLLTQVAGRAGRGEEAGQVIIQTFNPQHFCIDAASRHDYHEFYAAEIEARRRYGYPPFRQFVKFTYSHENRRRSQNEALLLREKLDNWIARLGLTQTDIVGPAPAMMERVNSKYRWQMIARGPDLHPLLRVIDTPGWEVDIDPVSTM